MIFKRDIYALIIANWLSHWQPGTVFLRPTGIDFSPQAVA